MKKDVMITIKSIAENSVGKDEVELFTTGSYYVKGGKHYISYMGYTEDGGEKIRTTITVEGNKKVTMLRGDSSTQLVVEKQKRNLSRFGVDNFNFLFGVSAREIKTTLGETGGDIHFSYSLDVNSTLVNTMDVFVNIKECADR